MKLLDLFDQRVGTVFNFAIPFFQPHQFFLRFAHGALRAMNHHLLQGRRFLKIRKPRAEQFLLRLLHFFDADAQFVF